MNEDPFEGSSVLGSLLVLSSSRPAGQALLELPAPAWELVLSLGLAWWSGALGAARFLSLPTGVFSEGWGAQGQLEDL